MKEQNLWWEKLKISIQNHTKEHKLLHSLLNTLSAEHSLQKGKKYLTLHVPSALYHSIIQQFLPVLSRQIQKHGFEKRVYINKAKESLKNPPLKLPHDTLTFLKKPPLNIPPEPILTKKHLPAPAHPFSSFYSRWTFSSFISGPSNHFALSLAKAVAKCPAQKSTNPLFIYGASGLGKTHLLHAIGHSMRENHPHLKVCYLPTERFFNECIAHIRKNAMSIFRDKYRKHMQVLLLDDVQILGKGDLTQDEFFHTFEFLNTTGCQIVLTSDRKPKHIQGLKERMVTRFGGGVVASIQEPDMETKVAILKNKADLINLNLSKEACFHVAQGAYHSVRELEGCLNKVKMFTELENKKPSLALIRHLIPNGSHSHSTEQKSLSLLHSLSIDNLIQEAALFFHLSPSRIQSPSRESKCVRARHLTIYIARKHLLLSVLDIARNLKRKDHSFVIHAFKKFQQKIYQKKEPGSSDYQLFSKHLRQKYPSGYKRNSD